jgi:glycosyltransferase involved in cell wall biosynthesis
MEGKPKVLQICHDYKGPFRSIARQYAGCFSDCDVTTIFLRGPRSVTLEESINGDVEFLSLEPGALRGFKLKPARQVRELINDFPPDVIIAHRYKPFYIALLLNFQLQIGSVVGVMHEYGFLKRAMRSMLSRFWPDNVHLIGVSEPLRQDILADRSHLEGRVHLVHHAIEAPTLHDSVSARYELGVPLGVYCYGVIARLVSKKNHKLLITAFASLNDNSVLAVVGEGELMESLKDQAKKLGVGDRVIFSGAKEEARELMKAFDCFVLPSSAQEAFGLVLLEAMAASIPIVCTDARGPASVVADNALLFKCDDSASLAEQLRAIQALSRPELDRLTQGALQRLGAEFSIAVMVQRLRGLPVIAEHAPVSY